MNYFLIKDSCRDGEHEYYDCVPVVTKMTHEVLDDVIGGWSLDQIIEMGEENWLPHEDNYEHYGLDLIPCTEYNKENAV
jgi:hypothetical protein